MRLIEGKLLSRDQSVQFADLPKEIKQELVEEIAEHLRLAAQRENHSNQPREWYAARFKR